MILDECVSNKTAAPDSNNSAAASVDMERLKNLFSPATVTAATITITVRVVGTRVTALREERQRRMDKLPHSHLFHGMKKECIWKFDNFSEL
jgi:hypothetical protein